MNLHLPRTPLDTLFCRQTGQTDVSGPDSTLVEQYQLERLRDTLALVTEKSPFYREHFAQHTHSPLQSPADLACLPFVTEQDIRNHGQDMVCVSQDDIARIITMHSSGTTGAPKRLFFTREDLEQTLQFFYWGMQAMVRPGQRVAILLPGQTPDSTGELLARSLTRLGVSSSILGLINDPYQGARQLAQVEADVVVGFPVQLLAIARCAEQFHINPGKISSVLLCSDYIADSICLELKNLWHCAIFSHYGTVETGLGGAVDCQAHQGAHIRAADLFLEIIDPRSLEPAAPCCYGEIVVTTLTRSGMPLIRYRTGDTGRLLPGPCLCGSHIRRLDKVQGRIDNNYLLNNGRLINMQQLDELLFPLHGLLDISACLITENTTEILELYLVTIPDCEREVTRLAEQQLRQTQPFQDLESRIHVSGDLLIHPAKRIIYDRRQESA